MSTGTRINNIDELKSLSKEGPIECFILLRGGLRSSKDIDYDSVKQRFTIYNSIDDSEQYLSEKELHTDTNIGMALDNGALYKYT